MATEYLPLSFDAVTNGRIASLDPVGLDEILPTIWVMNSARDLGGLIDLLRQVTPEDAVESFHQDERVAVIRDLGVLIGSIKRLGVEPVTAVPRLGRVLLELSAQTGMIPRNTLLHYTSWNPAGVRQRLYTGEYTERMLIESVCVTMSNLVEAVEVCERLAGLEPADIEFTFAINDLVVLLRCLEDSMDIVMANVTPEFFALTLRPYYEEITIDGCSYGGQAAAHVPLYLTDLALWASDNADQATKRFMLEWSQFGLSKWRNLAELWTTGDSLVTRVEAAWKRLDYHPTPVLRGSTEALARVLRALIVFRGKHFTVTRDAYDVELRLYPVGSGGGDLELLKKMLTFTRDNAGLLRRSFGAPPYPPAPVDRGA
jgi:hypothetical protein